MINIVKETDNNSRLRVLGEDEHGNGFIKSEVCL